MQRGNEDSGSHESAADLNKRLTEGDKPHMHLRINRPRAEGSRLTAIAEAEVYTEWKKGVEGKRLQGAAPLQEIKVYTDWKQGRGKSCRVQNHFRRSKYTQNERRV